MKNLKTQKGITLVALIITIIVLLILAVVTIAAVTGDGILNHARNARDEYQEGQAVEENMVGNYVTYLDEKAGLVGSSGSISAGGNVSKTESYVGYYADVDGNGSVDGVIYADLAIGGSGQWISSEGTYTINKKSNLNNYKISNQTYKGSFGEKKIISPIDKVEANDRFYVMALNDISSSKYYWYCNAYGNMSDYSTTTSEEFGTGKSNTANMMTKWKTAAYGEKNDMDLWKHIGAHVEAGWFVPSRGEWSAFGNELGITDSSYSSTWICQGGYWSSSQSSAKDKWAANFGAGGLKSCFMFESDGRLNKCGVRLSSTF